MAKDNPKTFNDYAIKNNEMHPIAKLFYDAMLAVEKLGASEEQTDAIIKLGALKDAIEDLLFRNKSQQPQKKSVFMMPTSKQLVEIAILFNDGYLDKNKLADMVGMCQFVLDRLQENNDVTISCSKEKDE